MAQPIIQTSFNSGEWAPALNARVDLTKYHSGAALLRNFFVDYRGGATARPGTRFIYKSKSTSTVRLIPFQASFTVSYVLEFGEVSGVGYLGFINNGAQVLNGGVPYYIASPYTSAELSQIKFAQNVNQMILCHPNHPPYILTLVTATNWTLVPIVFGSTLAAPAGGGVVSTLAAGATTLTYVVTAVDVNGQESAPTAFITTAAQLDLRTNPGSNTISWSSVAGAVSYNVYKSEVVYSGTAPAGAQFGFIGNVTGTSIVDSNITADFSSGPPIVQNPFSGTGIQSVNITSSTILNGGDTVPSVFFTGGGGSGALAFATVFANSISMAAGGNFYAIGDTINIFATGVTVIVTAIGGLGQVTSVAIVNHSSFTSGAILPGNPTVQASTSGSGTGAQFNIFWLLAQVGVTNPGTGYISAPVVHFSSTAATATAVLGTISAGNPTVPQFFQQRLVFAGPVASPQQFNMSQPGSYFNFNISSPIAADNAIQGTLVSGQLNTIQSAISQPQGLIFLSDRQAWLVNGGSPGSAVSPLSLVANSQAYNGASYPPPIVANDNILYVQSKGSIVRDLVFNFYTQVYTGTDISVLSSHLFYGFNILEWAWAEEPFKLVWAVRNDGALLSLTFLKEQELIAWAHSDTQGSFQSVAAITETVINDAVDAVYLVVQRTINGATVRYIERMTELAYPSGATDAWSVDAGLQYNGTATLAFSGGAHLANATVTGLATDNLGNVTVITPFVMSVAGTFTLPAPPLPAIGYTRVTVGLAYTPQLQTLQLDLGEPTVQGKRKKISGVTVRCNQTLGLSIGRTFDADSLTPMDDLIVGNLGTQTNEIVTNLVTGDARTIIDPLWDTPGQYCIQQSFPYPASILGVIPEITVGDTR